MKPVFVVVVGEENGTCAIELRGPEGIFTEEQSEAICAAVGSKLIEMGVLEARIV